MKIIDLLNKIAKGEKIPKRIKYDGYEFEFDEYRGEKGYVDKFSTPYKWFAKYIDCDLQEVLNDEVEIIEEEKDIEKFEFGEIEDACHYEMKRKINELIDIVNKLNKE